jgi:hypothetical protein
MPTRHSQKIAHGSRRRAWRPSKAQSARHRQQAQWVTRVAIASIAIIGTAILGQLGKYTFERVQAWYRTPVLEVSWSVATILVWGQQEDVSVINFVALMDNLNSCSVVTLDGVGAAAEVEPWPSRSHQVAMLLLRNTGRAELTGLKFALVGSNLGQFEVDSSAAVSVSTESNNPIGVVNQLTISVDRILPDQTGIVTLRQVSLGAPMNASASWNAAGGRTFKVAFSPPDHRIQFVSTDQGVVPALDAWSVWQMVAYQSQFYGQENMQMPQIPMRGLEGGNRLTWSQRRGSCTPPDAALQGMTNWSFVP